LQINRADSLSHLTSAKSKISPKKVEQEEIKDQVDLGNNEGDTGAVKPHKKWLFMNLIAADCNLVNYQIRNIDNQELVGSDENTHVVAYMDIGPRQNYMTGNSGAHNYYITQDTQPNKINSEIIEDFGNNVDMSNPETLTKFIVDAMKKYPSDHVAVILNDHGGGFTGAMADDHDGDFASTPMLKQAFQDAEKITGKKVDIIGFDACLMAETEVAYELKDCANILLASEESEMGPGWLYNEMLGKTMSTSIEVLQNALKQKIDVTPEEFAKLVVHFNEQHQNNIPTFSATDLTKMDKLAAATNEFAKAILASNEDKAIKSAISNSDNYGDGYNPYQDLHDLHHLADLVEQGVTSPELKKAAQGVKEAFNEAVIANESSPQYAGSKGLSIYAPTTSSYGLGYKYGDLQFAKDTEWDEAMVKLAKANKEPGVDVETREPDRPAVWPDGSPR